MSLANGRHYLAIPGPSVMPERVLNAMHCAAPNIYEGPFVEMMPAILRDLKSVARTKHDAVIYIANGHGAWEAALANVLSRGDKVLALATGRFARGWSEMAESLGVDVELVDFGPQAPVDPDRLAERLAADPSHQIRAVLCVHVDTSTSVRTDVAAVRSALDAAGHPALLMVDCIASLACDPFEMDLWGADVMVAGCQKGLMTPPGLGIVYYNDKADRARSRANCVTHYWDWRRRTNPAMYYHYFDGTAPTHHLYGLRAALDMISEEGLEAVWGRHASLARGVWAALETWGTRGGLRPNVPDARDRSHAVTSVRVGPGQASALRAWVAENTGVTLGIGLGMETTEATRGDDVFRIGHMGHVNAQMVMGMLGALEMGLRATGIPYAPGGLEAAASAMSEAANASAREAAQ
ncbi:MAG: aminotransferase class V-fold PLP-dependent enzyme [Pseudomonadota bacterium]